ncbi:MAG: hypothetical protein ACRCU1_12235 [Alsobacter sp.]
MTASSSPTGEAANGPADAVEQAAAMHTQSRLLTLKIIVIVLGIILVLMALVVFSTLIIRIVKGGGGSTPPAATSTVGPGAIPPASVAVVDAPPSAAGGTAARVVSTALGEGKLAVTMDVGGRLVVVVHDIATGRELTRFTLAPAP